MQLVVFLAALFMTSAAWAAAPGGSSNTGGAALALILLIAAVAAWIGIRQLIRSLRARKAESAIGASFSDYALEALVNAAKLDARVSEPEQVAIVNAMNELTGAALEPEAVAAAFARPTLTKDELVAYLAAKSRSFSREQKTALLKALLSVFSADGRFDEIEHAALVDYTAAVGFDRQSAPEMLRGIARDFQRGRIT